MMIAKYSFILVILFDIWTRAKALNCQDGEQLTYMLTPNSGLPYLFASLIKISNATISECKRTCTLTSSCDSVAYDKTIKSCTLNTKSVKSGGQLLSQPDVDYYEKLCLKSNRMVCSENLILRPQQILVGFAREVLTIPKFEYCVAKCFDTVEPYREYNCASLMYYHEDKACILNSETERNYPDLLTNTSPKEGQVDYVDNNCFQGWAEWTQWGLCHSNNTQIRQRFCTANNGKCSGESYETQKCQINDGDSSRQKVTVCPGSTQYFGCNQYCRNFTDLGYSSYPDCLRGHGKPRFERKRSVVDVNVVDESLSTHTEGRRALWSPLCVRYSENGYKTYARCLFREKLR